METMDFEEFKSFYRKKGFLPSGISCTRSRRLNEKELKTKYSVYTKKMEADTNKFKVPDYWEEWEKVRAKVYLRDNNTCQLLRVLTGEEKKLAIANGWFRGIASQVTPAHVIPRSKDSSLICSEENVYTLGMLFHNRMDEGCNPLTGEFIGKDRVYNEWWKRILPTNIYLKYKDKY